MSTTEAPSNVSAPTQFLETKKEKYAAGRQQYGRFIGRGSSANWIAADILQFENGVFQKHWDVIQDEATKEGSRSDLPMFAASFQKEAR